MREISTWRASLVKRLRKQWPDGVQLSPSGLVDIELGLTLHRELVPSAAPEGLWVLLAGHPFPEFDDLKWTAEQWQMLAVARHLLPFYRNPFPWRRALGQYFALPEDLRGFIKGGDGLLDMGHVSLCADRFVRYGEVLRTTPKFKERKMTWAAPGAYEFADGKRVHAVSIPERLVFTESVPSHKLDDRACRRPLEIHWNELLETARAMDETLQLAGYGDEASWVQRLSSLQLEMFGRTPAVSADGDAFTVDGLLNLIGMVSSGKTTLITVLAVWAIQNNLHVTLVVGDVMSALERAQLFAHLGIAAAPILGSSNRERHTNRLHRAVGTLLHPASIDHQHKGFDWLGTSCALAGLIDGAPIDIDLAKRPCLKLTHAQTNLEEEENRPAGYSACPVFGKCTFHQAQLDLVDAGVWIATPASLVYTRVPPQINREQVSFAELVYRRSDLVIVDEADQVQIQLDNLFSPSQTLAAPGHNAWINRLSQQVQPRLNLEGRAQLAEEAVEAWCAAYEMALMAVNRVYAMLLQEPALLREIEENYFTEWMILEGLATRLSGSLRVSDHKEEGYARLMKAFEAFIDDPLGERDETELTALAQQALTHADKVRVHERLERWIASQLSPGLREDKVHPPYPTLLEFAMAVAILQNRLNYLIRDWKSAELALQLDGVSAMGFDSPPDDFAPVIPVSPMGNVFAFQYVRAGQDSNSGDLRFFRCLGVGRWLLLNFHNLFAKEGVCGPHVILFSGTSWAGTSPSYHVQLPLDGVLRAPDDEVKAIAEESDFQFSPVYDENGMAVRVSGKVGHKRMSALHTILHHYSQHSGRKRSGPSRFEQERGRLPEHRQRLLLLVGSYDEARQARDYLERMRPDWQGEVINLVSDDTDLGDTWEMGQQVLQRGRVHQFADTGAWILIAPLLAVERGHNILNEYSQAAIGAVYFLVRPHPRPDDIGFAIQSINRWAVDESRHRHNGGEATNPDEMAIEAGDVFRRRAFKKWRYLLRLPMIYSTLPVQEREAVTWTQLITIWQVIGRLIRGGSPARVVFVDAAFAPHTGEDDASAEDASLLVNIRRVLAPYFDPAAVNISDHEKDLVATLYGPFFHALTRMKGIARNV